MINFVCKRYIMKGWTGKKIGWISGPRIFVIGSDPDTWYPAKADYLIDIQYTDSDIL